MRLTVLPVLAHAFFVHDLPPPGPYSWTSFNFRRKPMLIWVVWESHRQQIPSKRYNEHPSGGESRELSIAQIIEVLQKRALRKKLRSAVTKILLSGMQPSLVNDVRFGRLPLGRPVTSEIQCSHRREGPVENRGVENGSVGAPDYN